MQGQTATRSENQASVSTYEPGVEEALRGILGGDGGGASAAKAEEVVRFRSVTDRLDGEIGRAHV